MKVRYTATARRELSEAVDYLIAHAPAVAGDFADSIERALAELLRNPYSSARDRAARRATEIYTTLSIWHLLHGR